MLNGKRILVAEADPVNLSATVKLLRHHGAEVHTARTGPDALDILACTTLDAAVVEVWLPQVDGFGVMDRVRSMGPEAPPVVCLTTLSLDEAEHVCTEAGFACVLDKSCGLEQLLAALSESLDLREAC